jgi:hypothetical protein
MGTSYIFLIIVSFLFSGYIRIQQGLVLLWFVTTCWVLWRVGKKHPTLKQWVVSAVLTQLPGIVAVLICAVPPIKARYGEWGNGVLEIWIHPFLPILEMLPKGWVWHYSDVYVVACAIPFVLVACHTLIWMISMRGPEHTREWT